MPGGLNFGDVLCSQSSNTDLLKVSSKALIMYGLSQSQLATKKCMIGWQDEVLVTCALPYRDQFEMNEEI